MVLGLTGGVATGKSLVSAEFRRLGAAIIDADVIARELVAPGKDAYLEIIKEFGKGMLLPDGTLDRRALGAAVFSDPESLKIINRILHPRIIERIKKDIKDLKAGAPGKLIVVDAALLFETGLEADVDKVVVVYSEEETQIKRLMERDRLERNDALGRIKAQMPLKDKAKRADYVIYNDSGMEMAIKAAQEIYGRLKDF